jgi:hypothetical protein
MLILGEVDCQGDFGMRNNLDKLPLSDLITIWTLLVVGFAIPWWVGIFTLIGGLL